MTSGDQQGVSTNGPPSQYEVTGPSIFGRAVDAGKTARLYADAMSEPCQLANAGTYAVRHNPWAYFGDERDQCLADDVPLDALAGGTAAGTLPNAGFVTPDLCHDAHDCPLATADEWLAEQLDGILAGPDFRSGRLAVVITADEADHDPDNTVLTAVLHPSQDGTVVTSPLDHRALHELYEDVLGLPHTSSDPVSPSMAQAFGLPVGPR